MCIKTMEGNYINANLIERLEVCAASFNSDWHVEAVMNGFKNHIQLSHMYENEEEAKLYLKLLLEKMNAASQVTLQESGMSNPKSVKPEQGCKSSSRKALLYLMRGCIDDFEETNTLEYLREIVYYANAYLEQNHD